MRKGIEMSISLVMVVILVMVVLAAALILLGDTKRGGESVECKTQFQQKCTDYVLRGGCDGNIEISDYISEDLMKCAIGSANNDLAKQSCCFNR